MLKRNRTFRYLCTTTPGFVQQTVSYLNKRFVHNEGYRYYVFGKLPVRTNPEQFDAKIITKYGLKLSKDQRHRLAKKGHASVVYLRWQRYYLILATKGYHPNFFAAERGNLRNIRQSPIRFRGYAIGLIHLKGEKRWKVNVNLVTQTYKQLKRFYKRIALRRSATQLETLIARVPFEPYGPIYRKMMIILETVNHDRKHRNYRQLSHTVVRRYRRIYRPFEWEPHRPRTAYWQAAST